MGERKVKDENLGEGMPLKRNKIIKREDVKQAIICFAWLAILALVVNLCIPALNVRQKYDALDLYSQIASGDEPRTIDSETYVNRPHGTLTYGPLVNIAPGDYTLLIHYSTDTDKNKFDVCYDGKIQFADTLKKDETTRKIVFSTDKSVVIDCRTWFSGEGYLTIESYEIISVRQDLRAVQQVLNILLIAIAVGRLLSLLAKLRPQEKEEETADCTWRKRFTKALPVATLVSFTFCLSGPLGIYLTNINEFWFSIWQMLPALLIAFLVSTAVIAGAVSVFRGKWFLRVLSVAFGFGVALYIEGNFLVQDYGLLDGSTIEWGSYVQWACIDTMIWVALFLIAILLVWFSRKWADRVNRYGAVLLTLVQVLALTLTIATAPEASDKSDYLLTTKNLTTLSSDENIVVFMLDSFDAAYMNRFLDSYPEYKSKFEDFTFYPNTSTCGVRTHIATPQILTNITFKNELSYAKSSELASQYSPLFQKLEENNYDIGIYTSTEYVNFASPRSTGKERISNIYTGEPKISSQWEFLKTWLKLTSFRIMPHILKDKFAIDIGTFNKLKHSETDEGSYNLLSTEPYIQLQRPFSFKEGINSFRFYHTMGTHLGFIALNEVADVVGVTRTTFDKNIMGLFCIIDSIIQQMKVANSYDNSTIFIMADHGDIAPYGNPLLLIKPKNHSGPFDVSNAPISYTDLLPTFLELLGEDGSLYGRSIFEIGEDEQRTRYFYSDIKCEDGKVRVVEYASDSNAENPDNWVQVGPALDQLPIEVEPVSNFDTESQMYTVLLSNEATRHYQLSERPGDDLQVDLTLYSLTDKASHMVAYADGVEVFNGSVDPSGNASFALPEGVFADDVVELRFEFPEENESAAHLIALNFAAGQ